MYISAMSANAGTSPIYQARNTNIIKIILTIILKKMKKEVRNGKNPKLQEELSQITNVIAGQQELSEEKKMCLQAAMEMLYNTAEIVFALVPKLSSINLEAKDLKPKQAVKVKHQNKRREFIVQRKGQKNYELWAVKGVKDDSRFSKLWLEHHLSSIEPVEEEHIGFMYIHCGQGKVHEVTLDDGSKLLVAGQDLKDVQKIVTSAIELGMISTKEYNIRFYDKADTINTLISSRSMFELSGGVHKNNTRNKGARYNKKWDIIEFEDFRDGEFKER